MNNQTFWHGKPYYSLNAYCKNTYGEKLSKIALNAGFTCPNRDGTLDRRGCIFCSGAGSGDFSMSLTSNQSMAHIIHSYLEQMTCQHPGNRYIGYFQAYTNTYASVDELMQKYTAVLDFPKIAGISIATRPDCLPPEVLQLFQDLKQRYPDKFIWVELGLQTIHEKTASFIRRGYPLSCFEDAVTALHRLQIPVITHVILGLPGETASMQLQTISYLDTQPIWGIKLQLLHILKDTDLGLLYENEPYRYHSYETLEDYVSMVILCLEHLRPDIVVHRLTGDAPKELLLSPMWSLDKRKVLNTLHHEMKIHETYQGRLYARSIDTL